MPKTKQQLIKETRARNAGVAGEQVDDDHDADDPLQADTPLIGSAELAKLLGTTKQTLSRWRLSGFLPAAVHCDAGGTFWTRTAIRIWLATNQWAEPELAHKVIRHAKRQGWDFWAWIAPEPADHEPRDPELVEAVAEFEALVGRFERLRRRKIPTRGNRIKFLVSRLNELAEEAQTQ